MGCQYIHTVIYYSWKYQQMAQVLPQELESHLWLHKTFDLHIRIFQLLNKENEREKNKKELVYNLYFLYMLADEANLTE